jgi:phosphoglycolate phosphatase
MSARPRADRVRGVVFDLDGTLIDGYQAITTAVNAARTSFGLSAMAPDDVRGRVGLGLSHLMEDVVGASRAEAGSAIFRKVYDQVCVDESHPVPGLDETLSALRARGFRMSVASNKPVDYSIRILERMGVRSIFATIEGPETAGALKPDPAMIRACLTAMGVNAGEAVYVGDMTIDADAGLAAGVAVLLVSGGSSPEPALRATGFPVVATLPGLLDVLPRHAELERGA